MSRSLISESLQAAIKQLRPALPELLGVDYPAFAAQLEVLLTEGSDEGRVLDVFRKYPAVYARLQDILDQQEEERDGSRGGLGLYGYPKVYGASSLSTPSIYYRCETGSHDVPAREVERFDAPGNALCPQHSTPMIRIVEKENKSSQK